MTFFRRVLGESDLLPVQKLLRPGIPPVLLTGRDAGLDATQQTSEVNLCPTCKPDVRRVIINTYEDGESSRLNKLVRKASSVVGLELDSLEVVVERRMRDKFKSILGNPSHPLHAELWQMGSPFHHRFIP